MEQPPDTRQPAGRKIQGEAGLAEPALHNVLPPGHARRDIAVGVPRRARFRAFGSRLSARASPTSAVRGGRGRKIAHLAKQWALHFGRQEERRADSEALREVKAEPSEDCCYVGLRVDRDALRRVPTTRGFRPDVGRSQHDGVTRV
jgi:hypothetical protein